MVFRNELVRYLSDLLRLKEFSDFTSNGLQVEGCEEIHKVGFAVDACQETFEALQDCQMICVHHGIMWPSWDKITRVNRRRAKFLLDHDINLFVSHLPLDAHPQLGNNAQILQALGYEAQIKFGEVGWIFEFEEPVDVAELKKKIDNVFTHQLCALWNGPKKIKRLGVCSGGGGGRFMHEAIENHVDLYITGETTYSMYHDTKEYGLNMVSAGHYDTETFGVRALADHLKTQFDLETTFVDIPTGL